MLQFAWNLARLSIFNYIFIEKFETPKNLWKKGKTRWLFSDLHWHLVWPWTHLGVLFPYLCVYCVLYQSLCEFLFILFRHSIFWFLTKITLFFYSFFLFDVYICVYCVLYQSLCEEKKQKKYKIHIKSLTKKILKNALKKL